MDQIQFIQKKECINIDPFGGVISHKLFAGEVCKTRLGKLDLHLAKLA